MALRCLFSPIRYQGRKESRCRKIKNLRLLCQIQPGWFPDLVRLAACLSRMLLFSFWCSLHFTSLLLFNPLLMQLISFLIPPFSLFSFLPSSLFSSLPELFLQFGPCLSLSSCPSFCSRNQLTARLADTPVLHSSAWTGMTDLPSSWRNYWHPNLWC